MKITVVGASGLIGTKLVDLLTADGHDVVAASRSSGVDVLTGDGLAEALSGAEALVDVVNSPSFDDDPVMEFFTKSTTNLVNEAGRAGVGNYICLSIVGVDGLPDSGYMRAKVSQEKILTDSGLPYTIVRATQFAEFADAIAASMTVGDEIRVPDALIQPRRGRPSRGRGRARSRRTAIASRREYRWAGEDLVRAVWRERSSTSRAPTRPSSSIRRPVTSGPRCESAAWSHRTSGRRAAPRRPPGRRGTEPARVRSVRRWCRRCAG